MQNKDPLQQNPAVTPLASESTQTPIPAPPNPPWQEPAIALAPEVTQNPSPLSNPNTPPATKEVRKGLSAIILLSFIGVLLLGTLGFSYYSAAVRIPDGAYKEAAVLTDAMSDNIRAINKNTSDWTIIHPTGSAISTASATLIISSTSSSNSEAIKKIDDSYKNIQAYSATLDKLKASPPIQRDAIVKKIFTDSRQKIEVYKEEFTPIINTQKILKNFTIKCSTTIFNDAKTLINYDKAAIICTDFLKDNPEVPYGDLNDKVYAKMVSTTKSFLDSYRILLESIQTNDQTKYAKSYIGVVADVHKLEKYESTIPLYYITPPSDPTHALNDLKITLQNQQKVLFR